MIGVGRSAGAPVSSSCPPNSRPPPHHTPPPSFRPLPSHPAAPGPRRRYSHDLGHQVHRRPQRRDRRPAVRQGPGAGRPRLFHPERRGDRAGSFRLLALPARPQDHGPADGAAAGQRRGPGGVPRGAPAGRAQAGAPSRRTGRELSGAAGCAPSRRCFGSFFLSFALGLARFGFLPGRLPPVLGGNAPLGLPAGLNLFFYFHPVCRRPCRPAGHPGAALHARQASGPGSILSFSTGSVALSRAIAEEARLFKITVSFGSVSSLISLPCFMSHASIPAEVRAARGLPDDLVRISAGIEDARVRRREG